MSWPVATKLCTNTSLVVVDGSLVNAAVPCARGGIETKEGRKGREEKVNNGRQRASTNRPKKRSMEGTGLTAKTPTPRVAVLPFIVGHARSDEETRIHNQ